MGGSKRSGPGSSRKNTPRKCWPRSMRVADETRNHTGENRDNGEISSVCSVISCSTRRTEAEIAQTNQKLLTSWCALFYVDLFCFGSRSESAHRQKFRYPFGSARATWNGLHQPTAGHASRA